MKKDFLLLAATDMEEVIAASKFRVLLKNTNQIPGYPSEYIHQLSKALETAVSVAYSRPFSTSYHPGHYDIALDHLNKEELEVHQILINTRHSRYAHTDTQTKTGREAGTINTDRGVTGYTEKWAAMSNLLLQSIVNVAEKNRNEFRKIIQNDL